MNSNEFLHWLEGFLDANGSASLNHVAIELIRNKLKETRNVNPAYKPATPSIKPEYIWPNKVY